MAIAKNSSQELNLPEAKYRVAFQPKFAPSQPIEKDANGRDIKGTALLIFQGTKHSSIDWTDIKGKDQSVARVAFVFAVKSIDRSFRNIGLKVSYGWVPGNDLDILFQKLGVNPVIETTTIDNELFGDDFSESTTLDYAATNQAIEAIRGMAFTSVIEIKQSKKGGYYHDIDIASILPRLGEDGKHLRGQKVEETKPDAIIIDWEE